MLILYCFIGASSTGVVFAVPGRRALASQAGCERGVAAEGGVDGARCPADAAASGRDKRFPGGNRKLIRRTGEDALGTQERTSGQEEPQVIIFSHAYLFGVT